jgi:hypothetical protein
MGWWVIILNNTSKSSGVQSWHSTVTTCGSFVTERRALRRGCGEGAATSFRKRGAMDEEDQAQSMLSFSTLLALST